MKFSAFLICVEVIKCVKFQISRLMGFKVGIFRISPIPYEMTTSANSMYSILNIVSFDCHSENEEKWSVAGVLFPCISKR